MKYYSILQKLTLCLFGLLAASPAAAQQREWISADGQARFKAELVNAYGDTAFFQKEDDGFIHMPIVLLSKPDVARILEWARLRDAQQSIPFYASQAQVTKDVCAQWPNRIVGASLKDENISALTEPQMFAFLMIKKETVDLDDLAKGMADAEKALNGKDGHFIQLIALTPIKENALKPIVYMLGKKGGNWLMPNEWSYKDKQELWSGYWRMPDATVLIVDPQGHVLCDGSAKEPDGKKSDPIAFLKKMEAVAENLRSGGESVPNPYINEQAIKDVLAKELAAKTNSPNPQPIAFDFSGIDADMRKTMEGNNYIVSIDIGTDGKVRNLILKKGGDTTIEKALQQASTLWQFIPILKDGVPEARTVGIPIRVKAPAQQSAPQ